MKRLTINIKFKCADLNYDNNMQTVVTDFEDGVLRAVLAVFGRNVESKGCFYHLCSFILTMLVALSHDSAASRRPQ